MIFRGGGSVHPLDSPMSWLAEKKTFSVNLSLRSPTQMPSCFIKWRATARTPFKNPQWAHKTIKLGCTVCSKCYAGGKDEHVHPTLLREGGGRGVQAQIDRKKTL